METEGPQPEAVRRVPVRDHHAALRSPLDDYDFEPANRRMGQAALRRALGDRDPRPVSAPRRDRGHQWQKLQVKGQGQNERVGLYQVAYFEVTDDKFHQCVERYRGNYKIKDFVCLDQFLCLAFAQLTYRESLRNIEACLRSRHSKLYHLPVSTQSFRF